jgi:hypothetical protein
VPSQNGWPNNCWNEANPSGGEWKWALWGGKEEGENGMCFVVLLLAATCLFACLFQLIADCGVFVAQLKGSEFSGTFR